jgi:hypothetical protein
LTKVPFFIYHNPGIGFNGEYRWSGKQLRSIGVSKANK